MPCCSPQAFRATVILLALTATHGAIRAAAPTELLKNGDFSRTHAATGTGGLAILPDDWTGLGGTTDNAGVWGGQLMFSTAGTHNPYHKYFVAQSFDAGLGGDFLLRFDVRLVNPSNGTAINGAKVTIDNWYGTASTPAPAPLFASTYGAAGYDDSWRLNQQLTVHLTPGRHTLYIGTLGASQQNDRAAVQYDNLSLTAAVPEPGAAALMAVGSLALLLLSRRRLR